MKASSRLWQREGGFTLLEVLLTLAVTALIIGALYAFYLAGLQGWHHSTRRMESQQSGRIAVDSIVRSLRHAEDVEVHLPGEEDWYREVRFKLRGETRTRRFRLLDSNDLVLDSVPTGSLHNKIALGIEALSFRKEACGLIRIRVRARCKDGAVIYQSAVFPRNSSPALGSWSVPAGE